MAPRAGEAVQTPSSGSSVQGEVSKPKGGVPSYRSSRTRDGGLGAAGWRQVSSGGAGLGEVSKEVAWKQKPTKSGL